MSSLPDWKDWSKLLDRRGGPVPPKIVALFVVLSIIALGVAYAVSDGDPQVMFGALAGLVLSVVVLCVLTTERPPESD